MKTNPPMIIKPRATIPENNISKPINKIMYDSIHDLTLELVTHFFITICICISMYYARISIAVLLLYLYISCTNVQICEDNSRISIQIEHKGIEIHIKYRNKKLVTNSKCAPHS